MSDQPATNAPTQPPFAQRFAHFLTRTTTQFARAPLSILTDRGIENRLLTNMVEYLPEGVILAGGFVTHVILEDEEKASDIDLFFTSEKAFREMVYLLQYEPAQGEKREDWAFSGYELKGGGKVTDEELDKLIKSDTRYITFTHPKRPALQLLRMVWYDSPEHVIDSFDLTISQFAAHKGGLTYNPASWLDLSRKRLVLHRLQFPGSTLRRIIKYAKKPGGGFYACPGSLAHICEAIRDFKGPPDADKVFYVD